MQQPQAPPPSAPLTAQIARGDAEAFALFYELWFDRAYALARRATRRDESFCLDVVQDAMLKASRAMPVLAREEAVAAWIQKVVWGAAVDRLRSEQRRAHREREKAGSTPEADAADPAALGERQEALSWLRQELDALPAPERAILLARFAGGATLAEVGAGFGMSGSAAWGRIRRAVARLQRAAREWFGD